jgi:mRNA interferase MazF
MNRGDIYWVMLPSRSPEGREITKSRPCIIVSATALNRHRSTVLMVPLSTTANTPHRPISIPIASAARPSIAVCDQMLAVDKTRLGEQVGRVSDTELRDLSESLRQILSL